MVVPVLTSDLYETGVATVTDYTTAGAASGRVKVGDATSFSILMIAGSSQAVDFKVQVNSLADPAELEASAGWADFVSEVTLATGTTSAIQYDNPGFKWVRIIQQLDTSTDNITWGISTLRDKPGY